MEKEERIVLIDAHCKQWQTSCLNKSLGVLNQLPVNNNFVTGNYLKELPVNNKFVTGKL